MRIEKSGGGQTKSHVERKREYKGGRLFIVLLFFDFFAPSNNGRSYSPLRFSFCIGVKVVAHFIYRMPVRVDEALHLGMALVIGFFAGAATGTVVVDGISGH